MRELRLRKISEFTGPRILVTVGTCWTSWYIIFFLVLELRSRGEKRSYKFGFGILSTSLGQRTTYTLQIAGQRARSMGLRSYRVSPHWCRARIISWGNGGLGFQDFNMLKKASWKRWGHSCTFESRTWAKGRTRESSEGDRAEEIKAILHFPEGRYPFQFR